MKAKKQILILCDWFLPGYHAGGPIRSIATLTACLGEDVHFRIITGDRDFGAAEAYPEVQVDAWTSYEGREVFYVSPGNMNPQFILELVSSTEHEVVYLNSLFSRLFTVYPLRWKREGKIASRIVLAPRGMLGDGALAIKPFKKKLFLAVSKSLGLFRGITWQSTSAQETAEIRKRIGSGARIAQVSNLPELAGENVPIVKEPGSLKLCFISRISEKKNLKFALEVLTEIRDLDIRFDIYGPVEDEGYWKHCREISAQLPQNLKVSYKGSLKPEEIGPVIGHYHALFLPTHNENYGHIIVEALQHGRPVILSDQTPWRNLRNDNTGYDLPLGDPQAFVQAIRSLAATGQAGYDAMSKACLAYIARKLNLEEIRAAYLQLFQA